jgi:hypothetical protein
MLLMQHKKSWVLSQFALVEDMIFMRVKVEWILYLEELKTYTCEKQQSYWSFLFQRTYSDWWHFPNYD